MKKIINGHRYDTDTATRLAYVTSRYAMGDARYWEEELYRKRTGEFFLYGYGGALSRYATSAGDNWWRSGECIIPLTIAEAKRWAEEHLDCELITEKGE